MKSMTIPWSPCTRMRYVPSHLTWCKHFLLCNRLQLGEATLTFVPISLDFVLENLVIVLYPEISSSSFLFFLFLCFLAMCNEGVCLKNTVHEHLDEVIHFHQMKLYYCSVCAFQRDFLLNKHDFQIVFHEKKKLLNHEYE